MTPAMARQPMHESVAHAALSCTSCHGSHDFNTRTAAVDACLKCHNDDHTRAYEHSAHFDLWQQELAGDLPAGSGVSCATCHMPREVIDTGNSPKVFVQHNQNANLRPNEKMVRGVCMNCHGLGFTLDALADAPLVRSNFNGRPEHHVESIDL